MSAADLATCPDHDCRFEGCAEWTAGYRGQRKWLTGRSLREAENALANREGTLQAIAFNLGGNAATRDYIAEIQRRAAEMSAAREVISWGGGFRDLTDNEIDQLGRTSAAPQ